MRLKLLYWPRRWRQGRWSWGGGGHYLRQCLRRTLLWAVLACLLLRAGWISPAVAAPLHPVAFIGSAQQPSSHIQRAFSQAERAANLAQSARTPQQWDAVMKGWMDAIETLRSVSPQSPERLFAQRKIREYLHNLAAVQTQAERTSLPYVFPTLGSPTLDEQLRLYLSYVRLFGPPEVLVMGSSRTLQGLNPKQFQGALQRQGYPVRVFNFSVNGATAQVFNFVLQRLLTPEQLPTKLIVWGDGSRAFNSRRVDATFAKILESPGYKAAVSGQRPKLEQRARLLRGRASAIDAYGFLPQPERFEPRRYFATRPRVRGRFDEFYRPFGLRGLQDKSLRSMVAFLRRRRINLVFVNLPLSGDYLDGDRQPYEREFQQFLRTEARFNGFEVVDLLTQWLGENRYFADPSHLNQVGASALAQQLSRAATVLRALS